MCIRDRYVFLHSNKYARVDGRIALVGISKKHSAVKGEIERVVLRDYEDKKMTGKRKHGAIMIEEKTGLGEIHMTNGKVFKIRAVIKGKLLEINSAVAKDPSLLKLSPEKNGYIAVIQPLQSEPERIVKTLIKGEDYEPNA
eukprot:TRINITY_DN11451_c0_g2_i2.p1 TRINITY_DN11451_c0_g2~~TRINITY_DN11451_c0_g2_i2.p1  ORF type:complete len:141 (+),score=38.48 TRINITY_DN11451_c0_g2_i2:48-470(+)